MAGVTGTEVTPATGVYSRFGLLQLDSEVPPGTLQVRLKSPGTLEVVPAHRPRDPLPGADRLTPIQCHDPGHVLRTGRLYR
jgi:hypothetical protein